MSSIKPQTTKKINWSQFLRPKVGDVVNHNDSDWVSVNGKNSEPSESNSDWGKVGGVSGIQNLDEVLTQGNTSNLPIIFRGGEFVLNNDGVDLQTDGRLITIGFNDSTQVFTLSSNLTEDREISIPDSDGTFTLDPTTGGRKVRVGNTWVNLNETSTTIVSANYTIQASDEDLLITPDVKIDMTFPVASTNQGREIRLIVGENVGITPNLDLIKVTSSNSVIYSNTTDISTSSGQELSLRIKSINWRGSWEWVIMQNEIIN